MRLKLALSLAVGVLLMASPTYAADSLVNSVDLHVFQNAVGIDIALYDSDGDSHVGFAEWARLGRSYGSVESGLTQDTFSGIGFYDSFVDKSLIETVTLSLDTVSLETGAIAGIVSAVATYTTADTNEVKDYVRLQPGDTSIIAIIGGKRIQAINAGSTTLRAQLGGVSSSPLSVTVSAIPSAPSGLIDTATSASSIDLAWTNRSVSATGFRIERSTDNATFSEIAVVPVAVTSYSDAGLNAGISYYYRVRAYNPAGNSGFSNTASAATTSTPIGWANLQTQSVTTSNAITMASLAGAMGVRATPNIGWLGTEPIIGGSYNWTNHDSVATIVQAAGLENFRTISSTRPEYDTFPPGNSTNSYLLPQFAPDSPSLDLWTRYKNFVRAVVRRYYRTAADGNPDAMPGLTKAVRFWSYTPEIGTFWVLMPNMVQRATDYATMFQMTSDAVHEVDPTAKVFLPFNGSPYLAAFVDGFLPRATIDYDGQTGLTQNQVATQYDSTITYIRTIVQLVRPDVYDFHLYGDAASISGQKAWLSATLNAQGIPQKPVYSMEGGEPFAKLGEIFPTGPDTCTGGPVTEDSSRLAFQAAAMVRHFASAFASGYQSVTFNLSSEYTSFGTDFGDLDLTNVCGESRPAYYTFKMTRDTLVPFLTAAEIGGAPATVKLFRFTFPSPRPNVWVAWDTALTGFNTAAHNMSAILSMTTARVTHTITAAGQTSPVITTEPANAIVFGAVPVFIEQVN